jgi:hypothetical protein
MEALEEHTEAAGILTYRSDLRDGIGAIQCQNAACARRRPTGRGEEWAMALEMRAAPRPVSARRPPRTAARGLVSDDSGRPLTGPVGLAAKRPRSQLRSGRRWRIWYRIPGCLGVPDKGTSYKRTGCELEVGLDSTRNPHLRSGA